MSVDVPLRVPAHRVHPNAVWFWALQGAMVTAVLTATVLVTRALLPDDVAGPVDELVDVASWLLGPVATVLIFVEPLWRYRVHRWEITDDAVYTLEGWLTRTWRIVPIARIQTVDATRGPLQQLLGLATVTIRTASHAGSTGVEHLAADTADAVAHDLALRANAVRDDVT